MNALTAYWKKAQERLAKLPARTQVGLGAGVAALVALLAVTGMHTTLQVEPYAYVFTNLSAQDAPEAAALLQAAGIATRSEADGSALMVPRARVHDARILLAGAGLPRASGHVGFELFDRGELGVSQFTQQVNLRRALEGELARTLSSVSAVQAARVHLTLQERGLYKDDDHEAGAAVMLTLKPGAVLSPREVAGMRHLVSAAVPGCKPANVRVMDGSGAPLEDSESEGADARAQQRRAERDAERRVMEVLEPLLGAGQVVARASVDLDTRTQEATEEKYDPDGAVVRSEHTVNNQQQGSSAARGGVAGAASNQPPAAPANTAPAGAQQSSTQADETRNYELSRTVTVTHTRNPRVARMSVAVVVGGKTTPSAEVLEQYRALARHAVGFTEARGDRLELQYAAMAGVRAADAEEQAALESTREEQTRLVVAAAVATGVLALAVALVMRARRQKREREVAARRAALAAAEQKARDERQRLLEPPPAQVEQGEILAMLQQRVLADPARAAVVVRAWLAATRPEHEVKHGR